MICRTRSQLAHGTAKSKTLVAGRVVAMLAASMYVAGVSAQSLPRAIPRTGATVTWCFPIPARINRPCRRGRRTSG